ncbi:MAG: hypothetical protein HGA96_01765 [Desulfobulbaceae bacterium]|nr:hypothetical protein [Desulfobulbaceae bacterium]
MKIFFLLFLLLAPGGTSAESLTLSRQPVAAPQELPGLFTLILIGDGSGNDPKRLAIFDLEGDAYSFRPVTPEYWVKRRGGLTVSAALAEAERFFAGHCAYNGYWLKSLALSIGATVGYELVPDYPAALCESGNLVTVGYQVGEAGVIKTYLSLIWNDFDLLGD